MYWAVVKMNKPQQATSPPLMRSISRRSAIRHTAAATTAAAIAALLAGGIKAAEAGASLKGRVNRSVCKWCYGKIPLDEFCKSAKEMGLASVELLQPTDFPILRKYGLTCAMVSNPTVDGLGGIAKAWNRI